MSAVEMVTGITGLTGSGKSEAAAFLRKAGYQVIDADKLAHALYEKGRPLYAALVRKYGKKILRESEIDRKKLAKEALKNKKTYDEFTAVVYPPLVKALKSAVKNAKAGHVIVDMAVLYEAGFDRHCGSVLMIAASEKNRRKRAGEKWESETMKKIRGFQKNFPAIKKIELGAVIIYNNESKQALRKKIFDAVKRIERESVWKGIRRKKISKK